MTLLILFVIIQISEQFVFVGGDVAGKHIYDRGSQNGKRVQSNMGAKNHGVILPDANKESTINALVGAAFGAAGQRYNSNFLGCASAAF